MAAPCIGRCLAGNRRQVTTRRARHVPERGPHALQASDAELSPSEHGRLLRGIRGSADRLRRLAADLTAASQLEGGVMEFRPESTSPTAPRSAPTRCASPRRSTTCSTTPSAMAPAPYDLVPRLFDRLAAAGATSGTGLGLYLVREIARGHGGEADHLPPDDSRRRPTTFVIRFPAAGAGR